MTNSISVERFLEDMESILAFRSSVEKQHDGIKQLLKERDRHLLAEANREIERLREELERIGRVSTDEVAHKIAKQALETK